MIFQLDSSSRFDPTCIFDHAYKPNDNLFLSTPPKHLSVTTLATHCDSHSAGKPQNLPRAAYNIIHIRTITHNNMEILSTLTQKELEQS